MCSGMVWRGKYGQFVFNIVKAVIGFWTLMTSVMVTKITGSIKRAEVVKCSVFITTKYPQ